MKKKFFAVFLLLNIFLFLDNSVFAYTYEKTIPAVTVEPTIYRARPANVKIDNKESKTPNYYSNDIDNVANQFTCQIFFNLHEVFPPTLITPCKKQDDGSEICYEEYDVFDVKNDKKLTKLTSSDFRDSAIYYGLHPYTNFNPTPGDKKNKDLIRLDEKGYGVAYRVTTPDQQLYLKGKFIEDVFAANIKAKDTTAIDETLAWNCGGICKNLFNEDGSQPKGCQEIHISDVACYFNLKNQSTSYKLQSGKAVRTPFPLPFLLSCKPSILPEKCVQMLYDDMPFIPRGTVNTRFNLYNKKGEAELPPTPFDKGMPLMAAMASEQIAYVARLGMKPGQEEKIKQSTNSEICSDLQEKPSIQDKPSPLSFTAFWISKYWGTVKGEPLDVTTPPIRAEAIFPKSLIKNIDTDKALFSNFLLPEKYWSERMKKEMAGSESSTAGEDGIDYPDPGYKNARMREFALKSLLPPGWGPAPTKKP